MKWATCTEYLEKIVTIAPSQQQPDHHAKPNEDKTDSWRYTQHNFTQSSEIKSGVETRYSGDEHKGIPALLKGIPARHTDSNDPTYSRRERRRLGPNGRGSCWGASSRSDAQRYRTRPACRTAACSPPGSHRTSTPGVNGF